MEKSWTFVKTRACLLDMNLVGLDDNLANLSLHTLFQFLIVRAVGL